MIGSSRSYAIGMAHFQIAGGIKTLLLVCGIYLALFFSGLGLFYYMETSSGRKAAGLAGIALTFLMVFEAIVLLIVGSFRISSSIRMDLTTRMIESHRLMPVPNWRAVAGYILGGAMHAIGFALVNVVLAYVMGELDGVPFGILSLNHGLLICFAAMIWSLSALGALTFRQMQFVTLLVMLGSGCFFFGAYNLLPGFALLVSPLIGNSVFRMSATTGTPNEWVYPASVAGQLAFTALFFAGACRRYRGTYATTFTWWQAMLLPAVWVGMSVAGMALWQKFHFAPWRSEFVGPMEAYRVVASVLAAMALVVIPLRTITVDSPWERIGWWLSGLCVAGCAILPGLIALSPHGPVLAEDGAWVMTAVAAAHAATVFLLFQLLRRVRQGLATLIVCGIVAVLWCGPLLLDLVWGMFAAGGSGETSFGWISRLSPVGLLLSASIPGTDSAPWMAGLTVQAVLVLLLAIIAWAVRERSVAAVSH